jgi:hypothetical protein
MAIKTLLRKAYGNATSSLGIPMEDKEAKELDSIIKGLPQECREAGLMRIGLTPKKLDVDLETRTDVSVVTNDSIDRDSDVVIAKGLDWSQFKKTGGAVMFAHDYNILPVGRAPWVIRDKGEERDGWKAQTLYHTRPKGWEGGWLPDAILSIIGEGGLKGKSIGFIPTEFSSPKPEEVKARPELADVNHVIRKAIVIEYSVAPIPSNAEAIVSGKSYMKDLTDNALEHMGIILPSPYNFEIKSEKTLQQEERKYKVITQPLKSKRSRLIKAIKSRR